MTKDEIFGELKRSIVKEVIDEWYMQITNSPNIDDLRRDGITEN